MPTDAFQTWIENPIAWRTGISDGRYIGLFAIRDLLLEANWQLMETYSADGWLYAPGWFTVYRPTWFQDNRGCMATVRNDQGACGGIACVGGEDWFGVFTPSCRNGYWALGRCNGGIEGEYCIGPHVDKPPCVDGLCGDCCNGHFTGTFESFAARLSGEGICSSYSSSHDGFDENGTYVPTNGFRVYVRALSGFCGDFGGPIGNAPYYRTATGVGFDLNGGPAFGVGGGGYRLRSQKANVGFLTDLHPFGLGGGSQIDIEVRMHHSLTSPNLGQISLKITELQYNTSVTYLLATTDSYASGLYPRRPGYWGLATPYSLALIDLNNVDSAGNFNSGGNSIFINMPKNLNRKVDSCVVVTPPGQMMGSCEWRKASVALNGGFQTFTSAFDADGDTNYSGMAVRNYPFPFPLLIDEGGGGSSIDRPIAQTAWMMAPKARLEPSTIVGIPFNCMMLSKFYPVGSGFSALGYDWICISSQSGDGGFTAKVQCSLFMTSGVSETPDDV